MRIKAFGWVAALALAAGMGGSAVAPAPAAAQEIRNKITLTAAPIGGVTPKAVAERRIEPDRRRLKVEIENLRLPAGTVLTVKVDGTAVGTMTLVAGRAELQRNTGDGAQLPATINKVEVVGPDGATIASGQF